MSRPARARIDLSALQHNLKRARHFAPGARVMAVVKANAYGHGAAEVATALATADGFAVAGIEEAVQLRESGITQEICLLTGFHEPAELPLLARHRLLPVLHNNEQVEQLERQCVLTDLHCWVKVDTGMHRVGFQPQHVQPVVTRLRKLSFVREVRLLSHLADADQPDDSLTLKQTEVFNRVCDGHRLSRSLANSAGVVAWPDTHLDWVRPGLMLYGCSPVNGRSEKELDLRPVMQLESRLIAVANLHQGDAIGYGGSWKCPQDMRVGLVACGYADGYPRHAPSGTPVWVNETETQLVGRVSMDLMTVDLRRCPNAGVGDTVELWGKRILASEVARRAGTISYELLSKVTPRVTRMVEHG